MAEEHEFSSSESESEESFTGSSASDDDDSGEDEGRSFYREVEEWGVDLSALKRWFEYVPVPRCTSMLEALPTVSTTATLHFLGLNDLGVAMAVSTGWSDFVCANVLAHLPKSVWSVALGGTTNDEYGRAKFVNPLIFAPCLMNLGRRLLAKESENPGPGDVRGDVDRLPSHLAMLAYAILPEARSGERRSDCPHQGQYRRYCTCWIETLREVPPDPTGDLLTSFRNGDRLWPCPACANHDLHYVDASTDMYYDPVVDRAYEMFGGCGIDFALACDRCDFTVGRRNLRQCQRCHQWASSKKFRTCPRCHRSCCDGLTVDEGGPYADTRDGCMRASERGEYCPDCETLYDLPPSMRREIEAEMRGDY